MARSDNRLRRTIRYEAARIMAEEGIRDYRRAKEKACMRIGVSTVHSVPTNLEIEDSLAEQLSIFANESVQELHRQYLETACTIMQLLRDYSPRVTGAALSGNITFSRPVEVHLFSGTFEEVGLVLESNDISSQLFDKRLRFSRAGFCSVPGYQASINGIDVEILVYLPGEPYPPLCQTNGKPITWSSYKKVKRILESNNL